MPRLTRPDAPALAYAHRPGTAPTIVFLPGYASDMSGSKALAIDAWADARGQAVLRFDYRGCGASEGTFAEGTLATWRDDALAVIDAVTQGPLILVGSSMGGWIALLVALARPDRITALIGVAAAPDFTEWGFDPAQRARLARDGRIEQTSAYSDEPTLTTRAFWESGQAHRLLEDEIAIRCPVRLLHGQCDPDVPFEVALRLVARLRSADVQTILIKDGDHRLSRDADIALLLQTLASLCP